MSSPNDNNVPRDTAKASNITSTQGDDDLQLQARLNSLRGVSNHNPPRLSALSTMKKPDAYHISTLSDSHALMSDLYAMNQIPHEGDPDDLAMPRQGQQNRSRQQQQQPRQHPYLGADLDGFSNETSDASMGNTPNSGFFAIDDPLHLMNSIAKGTIPIEEDPIDGGAHSPPTSDDPQLARQEELAILRQYQQLKLQSQQKHAASTASSSHPPPSPIAAAMPPPQSSSNLHRASQHSPPPPYHNSNPILTSSDDDDDDDFHDDDSEDYWDDNGYPISRRKWQRLQERKRLAGHPVDPSLTSSIDHRHSSSIPSGDDVYVSGTSERDIISSVYDQIKIDEANQALRDSEEARLRQLEQQAFEKFERELQQQEEKRKEKERIQRLQDLNMERQKALLKQQQQQQQQQEESMRQQQHQHQYQRHQQPHTQQTQPQSQQPYQPYSDNPHRHAANTSAIPPTPLDHKLDSDEEFELLESFDFSTVL